MNYDQPPPYSGLTAPPYPGQDPATKARPAVILKQPQPISAIPIHPAEPRVPYYVYPGPDPINTLCMVTDEADTTWLAGVCKTFCCCFFWSWLT